MEAQRRISFFFFLFLTSSHLPGGLARFIRNNLASSITENMSALEDSQEESGNVAETSEAEKDKKDKILGTLSLSSS